MWVLTALLLGDYMFLCTVIKKIINFRKNTSVSLFILLVFWICFFSNKLFYFEIIVFHISCKKEWFPPVITSYNTVILYHNQGIDIDTVRIQNVSITTRIPYFTLWPLYSHNPFFPQHLFLYPRQPLISCLFLYFYHLKNII